MSGTPLPWVLSRNTSTNISLCAPRGAVSPSMAAQYGAPDVLEPVCTFRGEWRKENAATVKRALDSHDDLVLALGDALDVVDATGLGHHEDCAQDLDNIVVAQEAGRPLADCSCWVARARAAITMARGRA